MLRKGLDAGTAYEILSIDIADIDVGKNIGATLQMDQANADKISHRPRLKNAALWRWPWSRK